MEKLFVYGTLLFPQILMKLTGKSFNSVLAILQGYKRYEVKGRDYPAIIRDNDSMVEGLLLEDVDEKSMQKLTRFEGFQYEKRAVEVIVKGEKIQAFTFVWRNNISGLGGEWDFKEFEKSALRNYS